jgi:tetratricopeptide (TPR) repeat protein
MAGFADIDDDFLSAARNGNTSTIMDLIAKGVDVNAKGNDGETALMVAEASGFAEIEALLIQAGARIHEGYMTVDSSGVPDVFPEGDWRAVIDNIANRKREAPDKVREESLNLAKTAVLDNTNPARLREDADILKKAVKLYPDPAHYFKLGNCFYFLKDYGQALKAFLFSEELGYRDVYYSYYNAACVASLMKDLEKGIEYFRQAVSLNYADFGLFKADGDLAYLRTSTEFGAIIGSSDSLVAARLSGKGFWHAEPMTPAGRAQTYWFNPDGTYRYEASEGRDGYEGTWILKNGKILLTVKSEKKVDARGKAVVTRLGFPKNLTLTLSPFRYDTVDWYLAAEIGGKLFWQFNQTE